MKRKTYRRAWSGALLILLWTMLPAPFSAQAEPEEEDASGEISWEESGEEFSDEEMEKMLEEFLHGDPEAAGMELEEAEVIEDAPWTMTWLEEEGRFRYAFDETVSFLSSVPQGMVCAGPVSVEGPENGALLVYRDGDPVEDSGRRVFTDPGRYRLMITCFASPEAGAGRMVFYRKDFYFHITDPVTSGPGVIPAPEGFRLKEATLNGMSLEQVPPGGLFLEQDGTYRIRWEEPVSGAGIRTELTLDTSAPFLEFSQDVAGGKARIPLEFHPSEKGATVIMEYNGFREVFTGDTLRSAGDYRLTVTDPAGNGRTYRVRLEPERTDIPVPLTFALTFFALAGAAAWLFYLHGHMRII